MARIRKFKAPKIATVIGSGTTIRGDLTFTGGLHIDGVIKGNILVERGDKESALTLSEKGTIEGDVTVPNIIINGTIVGDVFASERVELATKAKVSGTVYYNLLEMSMGAEVNGQLIHAEEGEQRMLGYDGEGEKLADAEISGEEAVQGEEAAPEEAVESSPRGR